MGVKEIYMPFDPKTAVLYSPAPKVAGSSKFDPSTAVLYEPEKPQDEEPKSVGEILRKNLLDAAQETYREGISPIMSGISSFGLGIPKAIAKQTGTKEMLYPEQKTLEGKTLRFISELAGLGGGLAAKGAKAVVSGATKVIPKLAGKGLTKAVAKGAIGGATYGALQTPETETGEIVQPAQRLKQAGFGAGVGAVVGTAINKMPEIIKSAKQIPNRFLRSGLSAQEATRLETQYGTSNATLVDKIKKALDEKITFADKAYKKAITSFKGTVDGQPFFNKIQSGLRKKGFIDLQGNPTARYTQNLDPTYKELTDIYADLKNIGNVKGQPLSVEDFILYRDKLGRMLKDRPSDILVMDARNALYDAAEKSGMAGIKQARNIESEAFKKADRFINSKTDDLKIATEAKLNRIGTKKTLSKQEFDHIRDLEQYTGQPIIKEAEGINKINNARERLKIIKQRTGDVALGAVGGGAIAKKLFR